MKSSASGAVILSAARTPIGRLQGALGALPAAQLGATVVRAAVERAALPDPAARQEHLPRRAMCMTEGYPPPSIRRFRHAHRLRLSPQRVVSRSGP